jgi:hypothetical protein
MISLSDNMINCIIQKRICIIGLNLETTYVIRDWELVLLGR